MADIAPTLKPLRRANRSLEQFSGVGTYILLFMKDDLTAAPVLSADGSYPGYEALTFKEGKGAYRVDCKIDSNKIIGTSLGQNKGFKNTLTVLLDRVDKDTSLLARAINNLEVGIAVPDGDDFQLLYHPSVPCVIDGDGISADTGDAATSDRQTTITVSCSRMLYPNMRVKGPITEATEAVPAG